MQNFFARTLNLHNPTPEMITQFTLSTSFLGMGILAMATTAPAAYLASLRNLLTDFISRSPTGTTPNGILATWAFEEFARCNWDRHHILIDQMFNQGSPTIWNHQAFMSLPDKGTQHKLQEKHCGLVHDQTTLSSRDSCSSLSAHI